MNEHRDTLERELDRLSPPRIPFDQLARRRDRKRRDQRIRAGAVGLAVAIGVALLGVSLIRSTPSVPADKTRPPTPTPEEQRPPLTFDWASVPRVSIDEDAIVDVRTGEVTALPASITSFSNPGGYDVAPGGELVFFGARPEGSNRDQIFVANVDGTSVRQLTDAPGGVTAGGWSPDGTTIATLIWGPAGPDPRGDVDLVLVDVATGETTLLASGPDHDFLEPHFNADGQHVLFSRYTKPMGSDLFGVPVDGGEVGLVFAERWDAIFSPDGRTILYEVSVLIQTTNFASSGFSGQELWLADADGSHPRPLVWEEAFNDIPSWSPDGTRIVYTRSRYWDEDGERVVVVDVPSGEPTFSVLSPESRVSAVWLDDQTLLVDVGA